MSSFSPVSLSHSRASVRGDLIRQDDGTILQTAELQLEIHQSNAYCQEEFLQGLVDLEGQTNDGVDLRLGRQFQGLGMVGIDEGVAQVIVLIGELDGGLLKDDAFLHPVVLGQNGLSRDVADDDLQGNNGHFFHHGLAR